MREVSGNGISVPVSSPLDTDSLAKMGGHSMGVFRTINWGPYPITIQAIIQDRYSIQKIALITDSQGDAIQGHCLSTGHQGF